MPNIATWPGGGTLLREAADLLARVVSGDGIVDVEGTRYEMAQVTRWVQDTGKTELFRSVLQGNLIDDVEGCPELLALHEQLTYNTRDEEVAHQWRGMTDEKRAIYAAKRQAQRAFTVGLLLRQKNLKCFTKLGVALGIEMIRSSSARHDDDFFMSLRAVPSQPYIRSGLALLKDWSKPQVFLDTVPSREYSWAVRDNFEIWLKVKTCRWVRGALVESRIIHTVTGADGGVPQKIIRAPPPTLEGRDPECPWPFVGKYDLKKVLLARDSVDRFFVKKWTAALARLKDDKEGLLARPAATEDLAHPR